MNINPPSNFRKVLLCLLDSPVGKLPAVVGRVFPRISRKRVLQIIAIFVVIGVVAFGISLPVGFYGHRLLQAELEKLLPRIEKKWDITVRIGGSGFHPIYGIELRDLVFYDGAEGEGKPFLTASRACFHYRLCLLPQPGVKISGITLVDPELMVSLSSAWDVKPLTSIYNRLQDNKEGGRLELLAGRAGRFVTISPDITLDWRNGRVLVKSSKLAGGESVPVITQSKGELDYGLKTKQVTLKAAARIGGTKGDVRIRVTGDVQGLTMKLEGKKVKLASLSRYFPAWLIADEDTALAGTVETVYLPGEPIYSIRFHCDLRRIGLDHWRLAVRPLRNITLHTSGIVKWDREKKQAWLDSSRIELGSLQADIEGAVDYTASPQIKARFKCNRLSIQDVLDSLPQDFIPTVHGARTKGSIDADISFAMDTSGRRPIELEPAVLVRDFQVVSAPHADIARLKGPFLHCARKNGKVVKEFWVGLSNPDFVPYKRLGAYTVRATLTCEDGRFFSHNGFQLKHIRQSLEQNIRTKRFARGASTISMQAVKNLFLTNEKSLSRKFEEMLLTYALEQELSKERILEIYMNIIEWGPGIYGIGAASRHYFDKKPDKLTPVEAAFLASIIANPVRYHFMYQQGEVTESWSNYLAIILEKMNLDGRDYTDVKSTKPEFAWVRRQRLEKERAGRGVPALQGDMRKNNDSIAPL